MCQLSTEFCENRLSSFRINLLTNKLTNADENITSSAEAKAAEFAASSAVVRRRLVAVPHTPAPPLPAFDTPRNLAVLASKQGRSQGVAKKKL